MAGLDPAIFMSRQMAGSSPAMTNKEYRQMSDMSLLGG
jgi:hypothetical protein